MSPIGHVRVVLVAALLWGGKTWEASWIYDGTRVKK
jgi:hypothetical protein